VPGTPPAQGPPFLAPRALDAGPPGRVPTRAVTPAPRSSVGSPPAGAALAPGRRPWFRALAPRYIALIVGGVLIVGGGVAYGVVQLSEQGGRQAQSTVPASSAGDPAIPEDGAERPPAERVDRSKVTVSVLNGTTVPGLAARVGDQARRKGFRVGTRGNATEQARAESVVLFANGAEAEAREVGRQLDIDQREPLTPDAQALAGDADVVVVLGADKTR
jgi:hypothetical protein